LNGEIFYSLREAQILNEQWRIHDNTVRPHSALSYRPIRSGKHRSNGPEADDALKIKPDHPMRDRPHPTVEAFDETILHGLAGSDVMPFDPVLGTPPQKRVTGQLRPVAIVARTDGATM